MLIRGEHEPSVFYKQDSNFGMCGNPSQLNYGISTNEHHPVQQISNNLVPQNNYQISHMNQVVPELQLSQPGLYNTSAQNVYFNTPNSFSNQQCVNRQMKLPAQRNYMPTVEDSYIERPQQFDDRRPNVQQVQLVSKVGLEKPIQPNATSNIIDVQAQPQFHITQNEPHTVDKQQNVQQWETPNSTREPSSDTPTYREQQVRRHQPGNSHIEEPSGRAVTMWNTVRYEPSPTKREVAMAPIYGNGNTRSKQLSVQYEEKAYQGTSSVPNREQRPQALTSQRPTDHIVRPRGHHLEAEPRYEQSEKRSFDNTIYSMPVNNPRSNDDHYHGAEVPNGFQRAEEKSPQKEPSVIPRQERASPFNPNNAERKHYQPMPRGIASEVQSEVEYKAFAPNPQDEVEVDTIEPIEERYNRQDKDESYYSAGRSRRKPKSRGTTAGSCCGRRRRRRSKRRKQSVRKYSDE